jgi:hypothetical protein
MFNVAVQISKFVDVGTSLFLTPSDSLVIIDLTDYSLLPNGLVSMLTYFSMSGADKDCFLLFFGSITK